MVNDNEFVKERLDELKDESFQPNAAHARVRMRVQEAPRSRRWMWRVAVACAVLAIMLAMPPGRAIAQQGARGLGVLHDALLELHSVLYMLVSHF